MNLSEKLRVRAFVDNFFYEGNLRGIGTGNQTSLYSMTGTYLYPRYFGGGCSVVVWCLLG